MSVRVEEGSDVVRMTQDTEGVLTVEIPPRRSRAGFLLACLVAGSALVMILTMQYRLIHPVHAHVVPPRMVIVFRMIQALDALAAVYILGLIYTGTRKLVVSPLKLEVIYSLLGVPISRRPFDSGDVRNLRYDRWQVQSKNKTLERRGLRFEVGAVTHSFGTSIPAARAAEILAKIHEVCPAISLAE